MKKAVKKKEISKRDRYTIVLEDLNSKIGLLADGQQMIREDLGRFKLETKNNFEKVFRFQTEAKDNFEKVFRFQAEAKDNFEKVFRFQVETKDNFKVVLDYLSRIDDELQSKIDQKEFAKVDERLCLVEKVLVRKKILARV